MGRQKQRFSGSSAEAATSSLGEDHSSGREKIVGTEEGKIFFFPAEHVRTEFSLSTHLIFLVTCERFPTGYLYGGLGWEKPTSKNAIYSLDLVPPLKMIMELGKN